MGILRGLPGVDAAVMANPGAGAGCGQKMAGQGAGGLAPMFAAVLTGPGAPDKLFPVGSDIGAAIAAPPACHLMESEMTRSSSDAIKHKLLADFNAVVSEADQLLKLVTEEGGDKADALRSKVERNLNAAKDRLRGLEDAVMERTRATARATDEYVHENPWQTVGVAAGLSAVIGVVIGLLLTRR